VPRIHETAIVSPEAEIDDTVAVGPGAIIEGPCRIGAGTIIGPRAYIGPHTTIGRDNQIHIGAVIGHVPQDYHYQGGVTECRIGDRNTIREYAQIHRSSQEGAATVVGSDCFLMACSHVGHDCRVGDHVIMANGVLLAGHVTLSDRVFLSGNVVVHQFVRVGTLVMVGGGSRTIQDVPPYMMLVGNNTIVSINTVGLTRAGFDADARRRVKRAYKLLYRSGLTFPQALDRIEADLGESPEIRDLLAFCRADSQRGLARHA